MTREKQTSVAIVGAGYMAREHIRAFKDTPEANVCAIISQTRSKAEALASEFQIAEVHDSIAAMYDRTHADLVVITVPELATNSVCKTCFKFPWLILVEKPVGYDLADAVEIEAQARTDRARVFVGLNRRHYSSTVAVQQDLAVNDGMRFIYLQDQEDQNRALQAGQPKKVVENWMFANSIHMIDYLSMFGRGNIKKINRIIPWNPNNPWVVLAHITFDSGDFGIYEGIWNSPGPWSASIQIKEKRWELRPLEKASFQIAGSRQMESIELHAWDREFKPGLRLQAEKAVAAVKGGDHDLPSLDESMRTMRLIHEIYRT